MTYLEALFSAVGKTVLVTGGSVGIGRMIATAFVQAGAHVLIASRKGDACREVAAELNRTGAVGRAEGFAGDVSSAQGVEALVAEVSSRTSQLHVLVNNAGRSWGAPLEAFPWEAWEKVLSLNVAGLFTLTRDLLPLLQAAARPEDPAKVINLGSVMGDAPIGDQSYSYSASKAAVHHLTRILARELAPRNITVNAISPGPFQSRMTAFATADPAKRERVAGGVPMGRLGQESDVAGAVLFLAGRSGAYTTGAILPVDGGVGVATGTELFAGLR